MSTRGGGSVAVLLALFLYFHALGENKPPRRAGCYSRNVEYVWTEYSYRRSYQSGLFVLLRSRSLELARKAPK
jgi:hypothetical protein